MAIHSTSRRLFGVQSHIRSLLGRVDDAERISVRATEIVEMAAVFGATEVRLFGSSLHSNAPSDLDLAVHCRADRESRIIEGLCRWQGSEFVRPA